eukprot:scaffold86423_cov33-Tisochrysis_lutea.AAC.3
MSFRNSGSSSERQRGAKSSVSSGAHILRPFGPLPLGARANTMAMMNGEDWGEGGAGSRLGGESERGREGEGKGEDGRRHGRSRPDESGPLSLVLF